LQAPGSRAFLHSEHDVPLPCIRKLVAASSFTKPKVLTAASTLKFIPEELAVFCRDFRLLRFHFHENGLAPQAFRVANAIAQAREAAAWLGDAGEGHDGWSCPAETLSEDEDEEDEEEEEGEEGSAGTLLFENLRDWEKELCLESLLLGGRGPCVLTDAADLPTLADIQLAHLKLRALCLPGCQGHHGGWAADPQAGGRGIPGCPHAPPQPHLFFLPPGPKHLLEKSRGGGIAAGGETLLRPPARDRDLNCLLASLVQLLGDPHARTLPGFQSLVQREWVAAGHPFPRRLGLLRRDSPREEAPVFLLFLDCTWQLVRQFPAAFGFTEAYLLAASLLALHDSSFAPYFSTFLFSCQRQRGHGSPVSWGVPGGTHTHSWGPCQQLPGWFWGQRW
ncbi:MTMRB protein, partial [Psophia crepitans]|nr:MTMRB protein [Psophia crepitans]